MNITQQYDNETPINWQLNNESRFIQTMKNFLEWINLDTTCNPFPPPP